VKPDEFDAADILFLTLATLAVVSLCAALLIVVLT
jgi:hypothetical protein